MHVQSACFEPKQCACWMYVCVFNNNVRFDLPEEVRVKKITPVPVRTCMYMCMHACVDICARILVHTRSPLNAAYQTMCKCASRMKRTVDHMVPIRYGTLLSKVPSQLWFRHVVISWPKETFLFLSWKNHVCICALAHRRAAFAASKSR